MMMCLLYHGMVPGARNVWSAWTDAVKNECACYGAVDATLFTVTGRVNSYTGKFVPSTTEIEGLNRMLERNYPMHESQPTISFNDRTYVIKSAPTQNTPDVVLSTGHESTSCDVRPRYLVAWNGNRYLLVFRSKTMYIVALVKNRGGKVDKVDATLKYLDGLTNKLIKHGY